MYSPHAFGDLRCIPLQHLKFKKKRKYFKINTTDLLFWNQENTVMLTLFKNKTTFMLTTIQQVINSNSFGVGKKCCGLKPRCICAHLKVSHLYQSIQIFQRINFAVHHFIMEVLASVMHTV